ncbi:hypothetical protein PR048_023901 [Dryococelus australis]|uniref:DDE-1 domain-containing protein n=1 Tax=Dryococelus australis TaxID=614101 RepID=A0ABQ9GVG0_9NEOP|nr:hypothetical protein PR048_023901 [Dryococelus australis]
MFTNWVSAFDSCMCNRNRSIVLFDNCHAHPYIQNLTNIELVLPPNTIQPLDQSIIKALKVNFSLMRTASVIVDLDLGQDTGSGRCSRSCKL